VNLNWAPERVNGGTEDPNFASLDSVVSISLRFSRSTTAEHTTCQYDSGTDTLLHPSISTTWSTTAWPHTCSGGRPAITGVQRIGQCVNVTDAWTPRSVSYDRTVRVCQTTDDARTISRSHTYDASRNSQHSFAATSTAYRFTGKERDSESGLDYFESRYYGSSMGRFMSPDTFGGHLEDPQTLNHYSYVGNNPLSRTDPDGHDFYQQCGTSDHSGCTQVQTDPKNSKSTQWVQAGADGKATIITSDSIRAGQNTATMTQNGLQVNGAQGIYFDNAASHTTDANGNDVNHNTLDVAGSGQLAGFNFHVDGNCGGTCMSAGEWSAPGMTSAQARSALNANSFTIPFEDARAGFGGGEHGYSNQFRFGGSFFGCAVSACPNTPHISVPYDPASAYPKYSVPAAGMWHVDAHSGWFAHGQDIQNTH
jgi:RHS repeat-associated protein